MDGSIYSALYKKLIRVVPLEFITKGVEAGKSKVGGFMDLNYDFLRSSKDGRIIALSHYYLQNGDMVADPDMEIRVMPDLGLAEALTYQDVYGFKRVYDDTGGVDVAMKKELNEFLSQWLSNLINQKHRIREARDGDEEVPAEPAPEPDSATKDAEFFEKVKAELELFSAKLTHQGVELSGEFFPLPGVMELVSYQRVRKQSPGTVAKMIFDNAETALKQRVAGKRFDVKPEEVEKCPTCDRELIRIFPEGGRGEMVMQCPRCKERFTEKELETSGNPGGPAKPPGLRESFYSKERYDVIDGNGRKVLESYSEREIIDYANTSSHYEQADTGEGPITNIEDARRWIELGGDEKLVKVGGDAECPECKGKHWVYSSGGKFTEPCPECRPHPKTEAKRMGKAAFAAGKPRAPYANTEFMGMMDRETKDMPDARSGLLVAYLSAWDQANLAAPVPGVPAFTPANVLAVFSAQVTQAKSTDEVFRLRNVVQCKFTGGEITLDEWLAFDRVVEDRLAQLR